MCESGFLYCRINGLECGGIERGVCVCGECACVTGWAGDSCDCTQSTDTCTAPGSDEVCSGHGDCVCGEKPNDPVG